MSWVALAGTAISVGTSMYANKKNKGTPGQMGYDIITPPSIGEQSGTGKYMADYWTKAMQGLATGEPWRGYGDYEQLMKRKLQRGQQEAFYGSSGNRYGAYSTGLETGALTGLGGGRTQASLKPLQNQWLTGSQAIEEFLASEGAKAMQQREQTGSQAMLGLSQPYSQQVMPVNIPGVEAQASPWASALGTIAGGIDWGKLFAPKPGSAGTASTSSFSPMSNPYANVLGKVPTGTYSNLLSQSYFPTSNWGQY